METNDESAVVEDNVEKYPYIGSWHSRKIIDTGRRSIIVSGTITGCGLMQSYNISSLLIQNDSEEFEVLQNELRKLKDNGVGAIIMTLGQDFYQYHERALSFGFELISEYPNYRHRQPYNQRLYIFKL